MNINYFIKIIYHHYYLYILYISFNFVKSLDLSFLSLDFSEFKGKIFQKLIVQIFHYFLLYFRYFFNILKNFQFVLAILLNFYENIFSLIIIIFLIKQRSWMDFLFLYFLNMFS